MSILIDIATSKSVEVVDITSRVEDKVRESEIELGLCLVYTTHTTTGVVVNEAETGLIQDLLRRLASLAPPDSGYLHDRIDNNAHAHLQAVLIGNSAVIPIEGACLTLGTWQRILFIELDGPRRRKVAIRIIPGL